MLKGMLYRCLFLRKVILSTKTPQALTQILTLQIVARPGFESVLCWIAQLSKGCCNPLSQFYIKLNCAKALLVRCEFCGSKLLKRTSWLKHSHLRGDVYCCENPLCHASFVGITELTHILSPSGMVAMDSQLPKSPMYKRREVLIAYQERNMVYSGDLFDNNLEDDESTPTDALRYTS